MHDHRSATQVAPVSVARNEKWNRSLKRATALAIAVGVAETSSVQAADIVLTFTNQTWTGFNFTQQTAGSSGLSINQAVGTLTAVSVTATLNASVSYTYANDITVYLGPSPLALGGYLQVGGFSNLNATQRYSWANGGSVTPGTTVIDTKTLTTGLVFTGTTADPVIYLGNGYGAPTTSGTWTGTVTLHGLSTVVVPEPGTVVMGMACAAMVGIVAYRRTKHAAL